MLLYYIITYLIKEKAQRTNEEKVYVVNYKKSRFKSGSGKNMNSFKTKLVVFFPCVNLQLAPPYLQMASRQSSMASLWALVSERPLDSR